MAGLGMSLIRLADLARLDVRRGNLFDGTSHFKDVPLYFNAGQESVIHSDGSLLKRSWTEDTPFAEALRAAGLQWWCLADQHCLCQHVDIRTQKVYELTTVGGTPTRGDRLSAKRLELGAGRGGKNGLNEGYPTAFRLRVDLDEEADFRCDVRQLPSDWIGRFEHIRARHVLEHISWTQVDATLREWARVLAPGGEMEIICPNLAWLADRIKEGRLDEEVMGGLYGGQGSPYWSEYSYEHNMHLSGFTVTDLTRRLESLGLESIEATLTEDGGSIFQLRARKPTDLPPTDG